MTAHNVSELNRVWLESDNLCAVIDRAYSGMASIQGRGSFPRPGTQFIHTLNSII